MCHQAVDQHQSARCLFIDFSKAFDHVDHATVLNKLSEWGTDGIFSSWMRSYLYNRRQRVKIGNAVSAWSRPNGSIPQGSFFGPYVFLILINDLVANVPLIKFVDDITAVEIVSHGAGSQMQTVLDQIAGWCSTNFMVINPKKSKEMLFTISDGTSTLTQFAPRQAKGFTISAYLNGRQFLMKSCFTFLNPL
jgi:ribonuclease P/MRP protein subunit RPP40